MPQTSLYTHKIPKPLSSKFFSRAEFENKEKQEFNNYEQYLTPKSRISTKNKASFENSPILFDRNSERSHKHRDASNRGKSISKGLFSKAKQIHDPQLQTYLPASSKKIQLPRSSSRISLHSNGTLPKVKSEKILQKKNLPDQKRTELISEYQLSSPRVLQNAETSSKQSIDEKSQLQLDSQQIASITNNNLFPSLAGRHQLRSLQKKLRDISSIHLPNTTQNQEHTRIPISKNDNSVNANSNSKLTKIPAQRTVSFEFDENFDINKIAQEKTQKVQNTPNDINECRSSLSRLIYQNPDVNSLESFDFLETPEIIVQ